jgi:hypothetical protein
MNSQLLLLLAGLFVGAGALLLLMARRGGAATPGSEQPAGPRPRSFPVPDSGALSGVAGPIVWGSLAGRGSRASSVRKDAPASDAPRRSLFRRRP